MWVGLWLYELQQLFVGKCIGLLVGPLGLAHFGSSASSFASSLLGARLVFFLKGFSQGLLVDFRCWTGVNGKNIY